MLPNVHRCILTPLLLLAKIPNSIPARLRRPLTPSVLEFLSQLLIQSPFPMVLNNPTAVNDSRNGISIARFSKIAH